MADENTTQTTEAANTVKVKTVAEHFPARRVFPNVEEASAFLNRMSEELSDFGTQNFAMAGVDAEGEFDPEIYTDQTRVMVSKLMNRGEKVGGTRAPSTVKAIVVAPVPTLESILSDDMGTGWADKILLKELNHVAVRNLRDADNIANVLDQIPTTREGYLSSTREGGGGIMESFNELYKPINATLSARVKSWDKARFTKGELKRAMESAAYAAEYYPQLEDRGEKDSLFIVALDIGIAAAKAKGLDPTWFERCKANRDSAKLIDTDEEEDDDFDLEELAGELVKASAEAKEESEGETEAEAAEQPEPAAAE